MFKKNLVRIFILVICALFISCAGMTPKQRYLSQRTTFNEILSQFNAWAKVQPEETKVNLREKVIPIIDETSDALDKYEQALYLDTADPSAKLQFYLDLKTKLLNAALVYGFNFKEGVIQ